MKTVSTFGLPDEHILFEKCRRQDELN